MSQMIKIVANNFLIIFLFNILHNIDINIGYFSSDKLAVFFYVSLLNRKHVLPLNIYVMTC